MSIMSEYNKKKGSEKLFSEIVIIEWYDGEVTALCRLENEQWFIANLCYFNLNDKYRIYTLIETDKDWVELRKDKFYPNESDDNSIYDDTMEDIKSRMLNYKGAAYLMKAKKLHDTNYKLIEIPPDKIAFYDHVEKVVDQPQESAARWLHYFPD